MIIGSGLLAHAFHAAFMQREDVCIYAAGVSNSGCTDPNEFARERQRLVQVLAEATHVEAFVYFGTCSVADPEVQTSLYVQHKLGMEKLVAAHPGNLILRLPQVAGKTSNPHTLLNFLCTRILRGEKFSVWNKAKRNIIDVGDVALIAGFLIADQSMRNITLNVANPVNYPMIEIVRAMEQGLGKLAVYEIVERGSEYRIDIDAIIPVLEKAKIEFDDKYLGKVIAKYYKN